MIQLLSLRASIHSQSGTQFFQHIRISIILLFFLFFFLMWLLYSVCYMHITFALNISFTELSTKRTQYCPFFPLIFIFFFALRTVRSPADNRNRWINNWYCDKRNKQRLFERRKKLTACHRNHRRSYWLLKLVLGHRLWLHADYLRIQWVWPKFHRQFDPIYQALLECVPVTKEKWKRKTKIK